MQDTLNRSMDLQQHCAQGDLDHSLPKPRLAPAGHAETHRFQNRGDLPYGSSHLAVQQTLQRLWQQLRVPLWDEMPSDSAAPQLHNTLLNKG